MSKWLLDFLRSSESDLSIPPEETERLAKEILSGPADLDVYPSSIMLHDGRLFFMGRNGAEKRFGVLSEKDDSRAGFDGTHKQVNLENATVYLIVGATTPQNAAQIRKVLPFMAPRVLGTQAAAGCGDRLGLATPGHLWAFKESSLAPVLAQQSVRENQRTGRSPQVVLDDAMWGVFQEGWQDGYGADADHLKTTGDIDDFAAAGYTFYTIDPGEHLNLDADAMSPSVLEEQAKSLPWSDLETTQSDLERALANSTIDLEGHQVGISREALLRAVVKYGRVVAHTVRMYRHLVQVMGNRPFELEVSVDETDSVTTLPEHIYLATEMRRLGVVWISLAPRYLGRFEKGVDYIGDLDAFEQSLAGHAAVARHFGPYKLSIHSGSDKLSAYPAFARQAGRLLHLKTAGTSYLEALRTLAQVNPDLFRRILRYSVERYPEDRATYHVSAEIDRVPSWENEPDSFLPQLLEDFHAREIMHVAYGSVLAVPDLKGPLMDTLIANESLYYQILKTHFDKHFRLLEA